MKIIRRTSMALAGGLVAIGLVGATGLGSHATAADDSSWGWVKPPTKI